MASGRAAVGEGGVVAVGGEGDKEFAEVAECAEGGVDEEGVAAPPAEAGTDGPVFLGEGRGVDAGSAFHVGVVLLQARRKGVEKVAEAVVVVGRIVVLGN